MKSPTPSRIVCTGAFVVVASLLAACGGGAPWPPSSNARPSASPTATATATPIATPTASPTPTPVASPNALNFDVANPSPTPQAFVVSETGYAGAFNATMVCTESPASQSPASNPFVAEFNGGALTASATPTSAGAQVTFTVVSGLETGTCPVTITDANNNTAAVSVTVSGSSLSVFGAHRKH